MAFASVTYTSASGTTFALTNSSGDPIPYLRQADISVTVNGVLQVQGTDYTFNTAGTSIILSSSVSGATVIISRTTDISDATVVYTAGSTLTAQDLNNADNQIRYGLQEFSDTYAALTTGTGDLQALGGFIGSSETWLSDNAHAATTGAIDGRIDGKIDTALTTDVVAGDSITVTDNTPSSGQITIGVTNASITTAKLVDGSVTSAKIADGTIVAGDLANDAVTTAKILDANVTTAKIADSAITSAKIADGTIVAADLASDSVTTAKILDGNVTTAKILDGNITTAKLADSSVTSTKIADGTIVAGDLANDAVTTAKILDANVTTAKIADSNVTTAKIADSAVTAVKIADGVITSAKLNASTVVTASEQAGSTPDDTSFFTTSASDNRYVNVSGDTMSGALAMGSNKITGLGTPTATADATTKGYVDGLVAAATLPDADYGDITVSGTGTVWTIDNGVVTSTKIADDTIVNADINSAAAIAHSKLANITAGSVLLGNSSNVPTATALTGDVTVDSSGVTAIGSGVVVDADISASAEIAVSKLADGAARQLLQTDAAGTGVEWTSNVDVPGTLDVTGTATFDGIATHPLGAANAPSITFTGDLDTGIYSPTGDQIAIATNGVERVEFGTNEVVFNDGGEDIDFRIEGDTNSSLFFVDAGNNRVGIGTTSPGYLLHVDAGSTTGNIRIESELSASARFLTLGHNASGQAEIVAASAGGADNTLNVFGRPTIFGLNAANEYARIDSSGKLLVGASSSRSVGNERIILSETAGNDAGISIVRNSNDSGGPAIGLAKSRGTAVGSNTIVQSGDLLGALFFLGADGTDVNTAAASIRGEVDGTPGANDMPGRLVFSTTADGASSPTERMRIVNFGLTRVFSDESCWTWRSAAASGTTYLFVEARHSATGIESGGTVSFRVYTNGNVQNTNNSYSAISDIKLKENVVDAKPQWDDIKALRVVNYNFKPETGAETFKQLGLIAQEVELVSPGLVSESPDRDEDGNDLGTVTKSVNYSVLYMKAVKALQEAMERIEVLEQRLTDAGIA